MIDLERIARTGCLAAAFSVAFLAPAIASDFYVSPSGNAGGTGSIGSPWDLATGLGQPGAVRPGDTIWLRGGTYVGTFTSTLTGTSGLPIKVRQYPGERATLDGNAATTLAVAMNATTTSCTLTAPVFTPDPLDLGVGVVQIDSEEIHLFTRNGNTYNVDRGWNGTTPAAHSAGASVTTRTVTLYIHGPYTWFMGFEIMNSSGVRTNSVAGSLPPDRLGFAIDDFGPGTKIINMVIHDAGQGIGFWTPATDSEAYGNLIYYNGWDAPDRGHGHGIYTQNQAPSTKHITDNILLDQFAIGIQAYTEGGYIDNIIAQGNTAFDNGGLSQVSGYTYNLLIGGLQIAHTPSMISNFTYTPQASGGNNNLGYSAGCTNGTVTGNYFASQTAFKLVNCATGLSMTDNTFYGDLSGFTPSQYPANTYDSSRPGVTEVFVRPNQFEAGRANITVYNWGNQSTVNVDLRAILTIGNGYEVRNAQDYFGAPVLAGVYDGSLLSLPMSGLSVAAPIGWLAPAPVGPEFNVFIVRTVGMQVTPSPTPTPTPTKTPTVSSTPTRTPTPTPSRTPTPTRTSTRTPTKTPTPTRTPTPTPTPPPPPTGLVATAISTSQISVSWNASPGATSYELDRKSGGGGFLPIAYPTQTSYTDTGLSSNKTYVYQARARAGGLTSAPSSPDLATTILFTDDPLVARITVIRAVHVRELRTAVNAVRAAAGLGAFNGWTDPILLIGANGTPIKAVHISELRGKLTEARGVLGFVDPPFTDPTLTVGVTVVKKIHVDELRQRVK